MIIILAILLIALMMWLGIGNVFKGLGSLFMLVVIAFGGYIAYHHLSGDYDRRVEANKAYYAKQSRTNKLPEYNPKLNDNYVPTIEAKLIKNGIQAKGEVQCYELY